MEAITDFASGALVRLTGSDNWGDVMNIPQVENSEFGTFFLPYGTVEEMSSYINFADTKQFDGLCYSIPTTANFQGVLYNKAVFEAAGVTEIPRTPEAFIAALQKIKDNTDAIPLYTNYAAGWTMGAWDFYAGSGATGDANFVNIDMISMKDPFAARSDNAGPYAHRAAQPPRRPADHAARVHAERGRRRLAAASAGGAPIGAVGAAAARAAGAG